MAQHVGRVDSGQAAGYPPPDRLASKPSLGSVAELADEDGLASSAALQSARKVSISPEQVRTPAARQAWQATT